MYCSSLASVPSGPPLVEGDAHSPVLEFARRLRAFSTAASRSLQGPLSTLAQLCQADNAGMAAMDGEKPIFGECWIANGEPVSLEALPWDDWSQAIREAREAPLAVPVAGPRGREFLLAGLGGHAGSSSLL